MIFDLLFVLAGLTVLVFGGEALVRGASGIALLAKITPSVVGLTIVAAGTSMPEMVVSVQAAVGGNPGLSMGNVVGSNTFNIGAILGLTALILPLAIEGNSVRLEWPVMMLGSFQLYLLARDGVIDRIEGGFLVAALVAFFAYAVWVGRNNTAPADRTEEDEVATASFGRTGGAAVMLNLAAIAVGIGLLAGGSTLLVAGAVSLAKGIGVSDTIVGLTIVAIGTSAPELVTSLVAAQRGKDDIAVTNIIGSCVFNILGIVGASALILPLSVPTEIISRDILWMLGFSLALLPLMWTGMKIVRIEGALLLAAFLAYMGILIQASL